MLYYFSLDGKNPALRIKKGFHCKKAVNPFMQY